MALTLLEPIIVNTAANFTFANASITANLTAGNVKTDNLLYANGSPYVFTTSAAGSNTQVQFNDANSFAGSANFTFDKTTNTLAVTNIAASANVSAGNIKTDNLLYANGNAYVFTTNAAGANTQIQFNDENAFAGSANFTFNKTSNTLSVTNISANGAGLTSINGSNVTGTVANATHSSTANTIVDEAQPNITSVGLLTSLSVGPNSSITMTGTSGYVRANSIQGTDGVNALYPAYDGVTGAVGVTSNLTVGIGVAGNITANGNVTANYFIGNGSSLTSITGSNVTGTVANATHASTSNTVVDGEQPNITSVGNLINLTVSGNATVGGNLVVNGNLAYVNVETLRIEDPIIELGGGPNGNALTTNDGKDRGSLLHYYTTTPVDAFMGWDTSNSEFAFGSNVSVTNEVVTFNSLGNVRVGYIIGNGSQLSEINASSITSGTLSQDRLANSSLTVNGSTISLGGSATITANTTQSLALGSYLTGNSFNGGTAVTANVDATSASTANKVVARDANGSFSANIITATLTGSLANGSSNVNIPTANGNVNISSAGNANIVVVTGTGINVAGTLNATGNANVNNLGTNTAIITTGNITTINSSLMQNGNSNIAITANGNVTINAVGGARITATSTGANVSGTLGVSGNANVGNLGTAQVLATANITAPQLISNVATGTAPFVVTSTTQVANLNVANAGYAANAGNATTANSATTAGTVTTNAQPNITSIGTLTGLTSNGTINFTNASNVSLGAVSNVKITGGSNGQYLRTDGAGTLSWANASSGAVTTISNGTSNINIPTADGNITVGVSGVANLVVFTNTGITTAGVSGNITGANVISANTFTGNANLQVTNISNTASFQQTTEVLSTISGASGTVTHDFLNGSVFYHTNIGANFVPNFTNVPTTNDRITIISLILNQGVTPYTITGIQINSVAATILWPLGAAPTGTSSAVDTISFALIRSSNSWLVTGQYGTFS